MSKSIARKPVTRLVFRVVRKDGSVVATKTTRDAAEQAARFWDASVVEYQDIVAYNYVEVDAKGTEGSVVSTSDVR